ncbi:selenoprotein M-like [Cydia pomonella]|uniref:selenoprotein M-like n=1 Tax=Cydia pomonella TaxID=82600 RepID=UPI002ADDF7F6|nr:selenoprotein M-like [Cydia pomonella]
MKTLVVFCAVLALASAYDQSNIVAARIETCRGCSLNRLPQVKQFVMEDAPLYEHVEVKFITGAAPEVVLLGENDHELERLPLSQLDRAECNQLLEERGFVKKQKKSEF